MKENFFYYVAGAILLSMSITRVAKDANEKKAKGWLGIFSGFMVSLMGGIVLALFVSIFTDNHKWQWIAASVGSWAGVKSLDLITDFVQDKFIKK